MTDEAVELRKQLVVYADAITAFATAQLIGFVLLLTHGDCFTQNVLGGLWYAVCIGAVVNAAYLVLVSLCHRAADKTSMGSPTIASVLRGVRMVRYVIIMADLLITVLLPLAINYGSRHGQFFIDCKVP